MNEHMEQTTNKLIESLDLPKDLFLGFPCISLTGNQELYILNHRGILSYEPENIVILAKPFQIKIQGRGLVIDSFSKDEILIKGYIRGMEFC